jgi:hypothetical protein
MQLKANRVEILNYSGSVSLLAKRLFESVGMSSEGQVPLFDTILMILESLVLEMSENGSTLQDE